MTPEPILQKADFGAIYDQQDPRLYFTTLEEFDYVIPQTGADVFAHLLGSRPAATGGVPTVLDVCCSYGIVSTLLKTNLGMDDLYRHYADPAVASMSSAEVRLADKELISEHLAPSRPRVIGLDVAPRAVEYAVGIGSLDEGVVENLERDEPSARLAALMDDVDLITTTGGVGYVTARTFERLLDVARPTTHVAAFCLRTYDYGPIARMLAGRGLVTETLTRTFRQRRFVDADEQAWAIDRLGRLGLGAGGRESTGYYHAQFYLSRPAERVKDQPLEDVLADLDHGLS